MNETMNTFKIPCEERISAILKARSARELEGRGCWVSVEIQIIYRMKSPA